MFKFKLILCSFFISFNAISQFQPLNIKCIGGSLNDHPYCFKILDNGEFIVAGMSHSDDGDLSINSGNSDCWFVHFDTTLTILNSLSFGENQFDIISDVHNISDTSFVLLMNSNSNTGTFSANNGNYDAFIRTCYTGTNWLSPVLQFGGSDEDKAWHISPKIANGYLVCGSSRSNNGNLPDNFGQTDYWVMSLTSSFDVAWSKNYGGSGYDQSIKIFQLSDGNIMVFGNTTSSDNMINDFKGIKDVWIMKLNSLGDTLWTRCYGGTGYDEIINVVPIATDKFALIGNSNSGDGDFFYVKNNYPKLINSYAFYHIIDEQGNFVTGANKLITDNNVFFTDLIYSCSQDIDVFGYLDINPNIDTTNIDLYLLNFNNGALMKSSTFGGNNSDGLNFIRAAKLNQTDFLVVASTFSDDLSTTYHSEQDILLAVLRKYTPSGIEEQNISQINIFPNPASKEIFVTNLPYQNNWIYNILDISGKIVQQNKLSEDRIIDVMTLPQGVYILALSDGSLSIAKKIIIN